MADMSAIRVVNNTVFEAVQTSSPDPEDRKTILEWLGVAEDEFDFSIPASQFMWALRNPKTEQVVFVEPGAFLSYETAQQWEDSARATLFAIEDYIESYTKTWAGYSDQQVALERLQFIQHVIDNRGGKRPPINTDGLTPQQVIEEYIQVRVGKFLSEAEDLLGMAQDVSEDYSEGVQALLERFKQTFEIKED